MRSTLVEFARFNALDTGVFRAGDSYLRAISDHPVSEIRILLSQRDFNRLMKKVRYSGASEEERQEALAELLALTSDLLRQQEDADRQLVEGPLLVDLGEGGDELQQIDLVANAAELSAVPFECALSADGVPLFLSGGGVVLTRRVRGKFAESRPVWPRRPRVLFAWSAAGGAVPHGDHRAALLDALDPWIPPSDRESVFVELEAASLGAITAAVADGGFTHVHLLAHGAEVRDDDDDRFGIALNSSIEGADVVTPEDLCEAFAPLRSTAVFVTLAACDAGNQTDTITAEKSVAHELHVSGIPVVVASQLPFTKAGSTIMTGVFYTSLFKGLDVRDALHLARKALYENQDTAGHDWVSLVGYVQLPEGYAELLEDIRLESQFVSLRNLRDRAEAVGDADRDELSNIRILLGERIEALEGILPRSRTPEALTENLGLLGSAEKRLAELVFEHFDDEGSRRASLDAMARARDWYRRGFEEDPRAHWCGVQYLALHAALEGEVDVGHWTTAYRAAEVDRTRPDEYWALGSLAELALLAPLVGKTTDESAETYLQEMKERVARLASLPGKNDPFESTALQLRRYIDWWKQEDGFFPGTVDLSGEAARLAGLLG